MELCTEKSTNFWMGEFLIPEEVERSNNRVIRD